MSEFPNSPDLGNQSQSGDSTFENVWVFGKFKYPFDGDNLTIRSINVKEPSAFSKDVTFSGSIDVSGSASITGDFGVDELNLRVVPVFVSTLPVESLENIGKHSVSTFSSSTVTCVAGPMKDVAVTVF